MSSRQLDLDKVYYGDCLELMRDIPDRSIDMILCDLPYGRTNCRWDSPIDLKLLWQSYKRIVKERGVIVLTAQTPFDKVLGMSNISMLRYEWIWEKTQATGHLNSSKMPLKAHENILVFYDKCPLYHPQKTYGHKPVNSYTKYVHTQNNTDIYGRVNREMSGGGNTDRYPRSVLVFSSDKQRCKLHPTQKPVALFEYLIRTYTDKGMVILDNCAGSFTTFVACDNLGRRCVCIDDDMEYCEVGLKRVNENRHRLNLEIPKKINLLPVCISYKIM